MKKTKLPKSPRSLSAHAVSLTVEVNRLSEHFAKTPAHTHDSRAKKKLERLLHRRGRVLDALENQDQLLFAETIKLIKTGGIT